jgi:hypothetical protein
MTVVGCGRITPVQGYILGLAGRILTRQGDSTEGASHNSRMNAMRYSRHRLCTQTGKDFGYDLQAWHEYLLTDAQYASAHVRSSIIAQFIADEDRLRLVKLMEAKERTDVPNQLDNP